MDASDKSETDVPMASVLFSPSYSLLSNYFPYLLIDFLVANLRVANAYRAKGRFTPCRVPLGKDRQGWGKGIPSWLAGCDRVEAAGCASIVDVVVAGQGNKYLVGCRRGDGPADAR